VYKTVASITPSYEDINPLVLGEEPVVPECAPKVERETAGKWTYYKEKGRNLA
jgi:hypothetical protein